MEESGQQEMLNWMCLAGAMAELDRRPDAATFIQTYIFNSSKCFASFPGRPKRPFSDANGPGRSDRVQALVLDGAGTQPRGGTCGSTHFANQPRCSNMTCWAVP